MDNYPSMVEENSLAVIPCCGLGCFLAMGPCGLSQSCDILVFFADMGASGNGLLWAVLIM